MAYIYLGLVASPGFARTVEILFDWLISYHFLKMRVSYSYLTIVKALKSSIYLDDSKFFPPADLLTTFLYKYYLC